ncbi:MAG: prepilin-type N-terminal cleavage/methylation domain-containing protein [Luteolibacter sp.]
MKTQRNPILKRGFTLMELMVAMAITTIIVTVLVSITSIALDTWNRSRSELRAARQGKALIDAMARDFESLVTRRGNINEWLSAVTSTNMPGKNGLNSTNACDLIFYTAATDRYDGKIGDPNADLGGDISCVSYGLQYTDPIAGAGGKFDTFVLNRYLLDPNVTFEKFLGQEHLTAAFASYKTELDKSVNFVCENVYQFSVTFHVQVSQAGSNANSPPTLIDVPVTVGNGSSQVAKELIITGEGIKADVSGGKATSAELKAGRLTAVEISVSIISDFGIDQLRSRSFKDETAKVEFLTKNSYQYTKLVQLPSM